MFNLVNCEQLQYVDTTDLQTLFVVSYQEIDIWM